ncbi:MAG: hypothetical protein ACKKL5_04260 [Candidatus Komeilibacteria bacterium]
MTIKKPTKDDFLAKIEAFKDGVGADLSTTEDLSIAVMNLISLEEHFFFSGVKTKKDEYFDSAQKIRSTRKELLAILMPNHEGESWCIAKHLLATTMRLIEVGNKLQSDNKKDEAKNMFGKAYRIYSIFWALKLQLIDGRETKSKVEGDAQLEDLVNKLADCCSE